MTEQKTIKLGTKELAETLGVSTKTILTYVKEGMPCLKLTSRTYRYNLNDVIKWREEKNLEIKEKAEKILKEMESWGFKREL